MKKLDAENEGQIERKVLPAMVSVPYKDISQPMPTIYVANVGIVILYPFLERFFEVILCTAGKQLISTDKAVLALHFLVTGQVQMPDYESILVKILCGVPINQTLPLTTDWSTQDTEEAETLLQTVVNYWGALKNTPIGWLRTEFLQRNGKLFQYQDGWLLQVEWRDIDILLDYLPWAFATIKLPWMNEFLHVEWTLPYDEVVISQGGAIDR